MHLSDFPDRLSPMLVKELRQGMRTRSFVAVFLALQAILGIILLAAGAAASSDNAGSTISNIIFIFFSIAVLAIQPMRGIAALSSEVKGNTIDMMVLTRLSAWRIVTGKWSAIVSQSGLILVTIIPYLILRYFFGGMNLVGEIMLLALIFFTSATLTAITVGLSASSSVILRSILPMIALPIGTYSLLMMMAFGGSIFGGSGFAEFCSLATDESRIAISIYLASCAYYGFFVLSTGTSLIAPYAENHSTFRRLIALAYTAVAAVLCSMSFTDTDVLPLVFTLILLPVFAVSLSEFAPLVSPIYRRFAARGPIGGLAGFFLFPGWQSGAFFCTALTAVAAVPFVINQPAYGGDDHIIHALICLASLLFPAAVINLFRTQGQQRVSNYILFLIASGVFAGVIGGIADSMSNPGFLWLFAWIPPVMMVMKESRIDEESLLICAVVVNLVLFGILLMLALHGYRKTIGEIRTNMEAEVGSRPSGE